MARILSLIIALTMSILTGASWAQTSICPPSDAVGQSGIGDGCSVPTAAPYFFPSVGIFENTFTPACNKHDKCYTTLGTSYSECNGGFLSDMNAACRSNFNPVLLAPAYASCMATAQTYYAAVVAYAAGHDPLLLTHADALNRSRAMETQIKASTCVTTPQASTLFDPSLVTLIDNTFQTYAHRQPTAYEFFDAADAGDIVRDNAGWQAILVNKAVTAALYTPPTPPNVTSDSDEATYITVGVAPALPGYEYTWGVNGAAATTIPVHTATYTHTVRATGFVAITAPGFNDPRLAPPGLRNFATFDIPFVIEGINGPCRGNNCKPY